jgi:hypothetical protein
MKPGKWHIIGIRDTQLTARRDGGVTLKLKSILQFSKSVLGEKFVQGRPNVERNSDSAGLFE